MIKATTFFGVIDSVYLDPERRMQPYVRIEGDEAYSIQNIIYKQFEKGDTLLKPPGTMKYYWIKDGDTTLFYQKTGNYDLRDTGKIFNPFR